MDKKFYTNDFEQLLKENADQFKMSPSKKVWHGIYNDIHPGRRWPSVAMSLLFVFTLILVGYLNIEQTNHKYSSGLSNDVKPDNNDGIIVLNKQLNKTAQKNNSRNKKAILSQSGLINRPIKNRTNSIKPEGSISINDINISEQINAAENRATVLSMGNTSPSENDKKTGRHEIATSVSHITGTVVTNEEATSLNTNNISNNNTAANNAIITSGSSIFSEPNTFTGRQESADNPVKSGSAPKTDHIASNETHAKMINARRLRLRKNSKISWAYYISPSISYRTYSQQGNPADQLLLGYNSSSGNLIMNSAVTHLVSPGLEAGVAMKYEIAKKLKFTSGFQVNYSAYTMKANNIHPIIATLILHNPRTESPYSFSSISYFGNGPGNVPVNLHNYSVQIGLPVGLEYQVAGNDHIQFSAAGSFDPSLVIANKYYLLSTDKRNYLTDASLSRNWNIGTNIGTFISFNSNKFKWQVGPQVHYQLFSSYKNEYQVREHFIDYGVRFAISRTGK